MSKVFKVNLDEDFFEEMFHYLEGESVSGKGHEYATNSRNVDDAVSNICCDLMSFFSSRFEEVVPEDNKEAQKQQPTNEGQNGQ